jgi:hypothetical protein
MAQRATFQPRFALGLIYFFGFVILWGLILAGPAMFEALRQLPPDADPQEAGREVVREALSGRIPVAIGAAFLTVGALGWVGALPGVRPRD